MKDPQQSRAQRALGMALALLVGGPAALIAEPAWTLRAAVDRVLEANPDMETARARMEAAQARRETAASAWWPRLDLEASYVQTNDPMQGFGIILSQGTFDNTIDFNDPGQLDSLSGTVQGSYRLYAGGARDARVQAAEAGAEMSASGLAAAEARLANATVAAYFGIRQADKLVESLESAVQVLEENLRVSKAKEEAGELIRTERLNIEVRLAGLRRQLLGARNEARMARNQLAFLLDLPPDGQLELAAEDPTLSELREPARRDIAGRPELQAARARVRAAEEQLRAAKAGHRPTVDAFANYKADKGWRRDGDGTSWTAGISVSLPVFDGFATRSKVAEAQAGLREARQQLRKLRRSLQVELEEARLAHELAREQRDVARRQVEQAREAAQLSRQRFAAGTLLSTELIGVESRLTKSRMELAIASARERAALARLRRAAGLPVLP